MFKRRIPTVATASAVRKSPPTPPTASRSDPSRRRFLAASARAVTVVIAIGVASPLAGCSLASGFRLDVQQGNALDAERVDQLQIGMTERQVQFLLGSPAITAAFREGERWDYVYFRRPGIGRSERARLTVHFTNGRVSRIERHLPDADRTTAGLPDGASPEAL